jgi:hypothetical protein
MENKMSVQTYRITRPGALHARIEWPDGEPVKGPRFEMNSNFQFIPIKRNGKDFETILYGTRPGFRNEIKLTKEDAAKLHHLNLVPVFGPASAGTPSPRISDPPEGKYNIPANWKMESHLNKSTWACKILGERFRVMTVRESDGIIEGYLSHAAEHTDSRTGPTSHQPAGNP